MNDIEYSILCGLKTGSAERYIYAVSKIDTAYFTNSSYRLLYHFLMHIFQHTGYPCVENMFEQLSETITNLQRREEISSVWRSLTETINEPVFRQAVFRLEQQYADTTFALKINTALEINNHGTIVDGEEYYGREDAINYLVKQLPSIKTSGNVDSVSVSMTKTEAIEQYKHQKEVGQAARINLGIQSLDKILGGIDNTDLGLLVGYTGSGKTTFCANIARHVALHQNRPVLYITSETGSDRIQRRIIVSHSVNKRLFDTPVPYTELKQGRLSEEQYNSYLAVIDDIDRNTKTGKYAPLDIVSASSGGLRFIRSCIESYQRKFSSYGGIGLVVVDYLTLMARSYDRIVLVDLVTKTKELCQSMQVPIFTPWQANTTGWQLAKQKGMYDESSVAETAEAIRTCDIAIGILRDEHNLRRMTANIFKNRDGPISRAINLKPLLEYSYIGALDGDMEFNY